MSARSARRSPGSASVPTRPAASGHIYRAVDGEPGTPSLSATSNHCTASTTWMRRADDEIRRALEAATQDDRLGVGRRAAMRAAPAGARVGPAGTRLDNRPAVGQRMRSPRGTAGRCPPLARGDPAAIGPAAAAVTRRARTTAIASTATIADATAHRRPRAADRYGPAQVGTDSLAGAGRCRRDGTGATSSRGVCHERRRQEVPWRARSRPRAWPELGEFAVIDRLVAGRSQPRVVAVGPG